MRSGNSRAGRSRSITAAWPRLRLDEPTGRLGLWIFSSAVPFLKSQANPSGMNLIISYTRIVFLVTNLLSQDETVFVCESFPSANLKAFEVG